MQQKIWAWSWIGLLMTYYTVSSLNNTTINAKWLCKCMYLLLARYSTPVCSVFRGCNGQLSERVFSRGFVTQIRESILYGRKLQGNSKRFAQTDKSRRGAEQKFSVLCAARCTQQLHRDVGTYISWMFPNKKCVGLNLSPTTPLIRIL
jgi:hypothetical protein